MKVNPKNHRHSNITSTAINKNIEYQLKTNDYAS